MRKSVVRGTKECCPGKAKIAPPVGAHTAELLLAVGYARHEAEAMFASGAVGGAPGAKL